MPTATLTQMIWEYVRTTATYWWVIVPGTLLPLRDAFKLFKRFGETPRWLELAVIVVCLSIAQFLPYRNSVLNLHRVIEEKRQLSTKINAQGAELQDDKRQIDNLKNRVPHPANEPNDSLRRRTLRLADEYIAFFIKSQENQPPVAIPNSAEPNPSEERKKAIQAYQSYWQKVGDYYGSHFKARFIGIVKEYESRGVRVGFLGNEFAQRLPIIPQRGSAWEGTDEVSRFRELAYHVDARDHLIVFGF